MEFHWYFSRLIAQAVAKFNSVDVHNIKVYNLKGELKQMEVKENPLFGSMEKLFDLIPESLEDPEQDKRWHWF